MMMLVASRFLIPPSFGSWGVAYVYQCSSAMTIALFVPMYSCTAWTGLPAKADSSRYTTHIPGTTDVKNERKSILFNCLTDLNGDWLFALFRGFTVRT
jgi:hypothetical protein